jgi:hypothetical protein
MLCRRSQSRSPPRQISGLGLLDAAVVRGVLPEVAERAIAAASATGAIR